MFDYLTTILPTFLGGLKTTIFYFIMTLIFAIPIGLVSALIKAKRIPVFTQLIGLYIMIMRGTPLLLQILFVYIGLPYIGVSFEREVAAIIALSLNYGAYFAEIFRAGIVDIDKGQHEAADVLGLTPFRTFRRIILPQMVKKVLPPTANEVINLVKDTALLYVLGITELLTLAKVTSNADVSLLPYFIAGVLYFIFISLLAKLFQKAEKHFSYYE